MDVTYAEYIPKGEFKRGVRFVLICVSGDRFLWLSSTDTACVETQSLVVASWLSSGVL